MVALLWFGPPYPPKSTPGQRGSPPHPECDVAGGFAGAVSGLWVYFFFPLALGAALGFAAGLGRWTLTLSRSCSIFRSTIPFFQD